MALYTTYRCIQYLPCFESREQDFLRINTSLYIYHNSQAQGPEPLFSIIEDVFVDIINMHLFFLNINGSREENQLKRLHTFLL